MTTPHEANAMTEMNARPDPLRGKPSLGMIGLLAVNLIVGYEWFMSSRPIIPRLGLPRSASGRAFIAVIALPSLCVVMIYLPIWLFAPAAQRPADAWSRAPSNPPSRRMIEIGRASCRERV